MRTRCVHFLVAILLIFSGVAQCQYPPELLQQRWDASWITAVDVPQRDAVVLHFRKEIDLAQKPEHFVVHVSADNQFLLYVNQRWVGFGPAHSDLAHTRYETYDLAPFLNTGKNIVAATVWNFGILTPLSQISDRTGFVLQGSGATESSVNTDESWQVEQEKGIRVLPTPDNVRNKYYVSEPAEQIDGNAFDWNWDAESGSGTNWKKALALQHASLQGGAIQNDNWQLVADPLPTMELKLEPAGKVVRAEGVEASNFPEKSFTVPPHSKVAVLLDRSHLTTAYPELTLSGGKGASVRLIYAEALFDDKGLKGNRNELPGSISKVSSMSSSPMELRIEPSCRLPGKHGDICN